MRIKRFSKKTYIISFVFVMLANVCLTTFLIHNILAQTSDNKFKGQLPIIAQVIKQTDSPLHITIINVDNSNPNYQLVNYSVQNISDKPIRGYVIWGGSKNTGKIITNFLPIKPFQINNIFTGELLIERENIKPDEPLIFSIDYVKFTNDRFWGEDKQKQSEYIDGGLIGEEVAIKQVKNLIEKNEESVLSSIFEKHLVDIEVSLPEEFKSKSGKWQKGFNNGYKGVFSFLKSQKERDTEKLLEKLSEVQNNLQLERRLEQ